MNVHESNLKIYMYRIKEANQIVNSFLVPLNKVQLNWQPNSSSWSAAQCLKHWLLASEKYITQLKKVIEKGKEKNKLASRPYQKSFSGRLMIFAVDPSIKIPIPSPKAFQPIKSQLYDTTIVSQFTTTLQELTFLIKESENLDWNHLKITSPITSLMKLNIGDVFETLTLHALRHLKQAQKAIAIENFPK